MNVPDIRMSVLFITSYYSGLKKSIESDLWQPTGMPAITKLFDALFERNIHFDSVFVDRSHRMTIKSSKHLNRHFNSFFYIYSIPKPSNSSLINFFYYLFREAQLILYCLAIKCSTKYNVVYIDRSNVLIGSIFSLFGLKVILRIHGIANFNQKFSDFRYRLKHCIRILCFRASFFHIICTEDGTPGTQFIDRYCKRKTPRSVLLNGVDMHVQSGDLSKIKYELGIQKQFPLILYVGRFSQDKGILEFVEAIRLISLQTDNYYALIIGYGELHDTVNSVITANNLTQVRLLTEVKHAEISNYYLISDIYVSLNKYGNLSNTVLEAIRASLCVITFEPCEKSGRDISTKNLFNDSAMYIKRDNIAYSLSASLTVLLNNHSLIRSRKNLTSRLNARIPSWNERTSYEIEVIENAGK